MNPAKCKSCGVPFVKHEGLQITCKRYQVTSGVLDQIAARPRNTADRRLARATLAFLESQT